MTGPSRQRRPDLVLCRSGPDGSGWLARALSTHPDVGVVSPDAESALNPLPDVFPAASPFATASRDGLRTDVFEALAATAPTDGITLWTAQHAFVQPQLPFVIRESLPDAKLIFCLRNPVDLVWDLWRAAPPEAGLGDDFPRAIAACHRAMLDASRFDQRANWDRHFRELPLRETLLEHGMFGPTLERFSRVLGRDRMLVLPTERLGDDPRATLDEALAFLGLPTSWPGRTEVPAFPDEAAGLPSDADRELLRPWFHESNERLRSLLGWSPEALT